jgi:hypothetical protein
MSRPTQAHLERIVSKNESLEARQKILSQMPYYMGAKLLEVRIDPQLVIYRWSVEDQEDQQICTLSAFWGDSQERLLSGKEPLTGQELINCAKGNAFSGIVNTAKLCGYNSDVEKFKVNLNQAVEDLGLDINSIKSLKKLIFP